MLLDEIGYLIDSNSTSRTLGQNLFKGFKPPTAPNTATFLYEYSGLQPQHSLGGSSTPAWENPRAQIVNRSSDYQTARNRAETDYRLCMGQTNVTLKPSSSATGTRYLSLEPLQQPFSIGQDENALHQIVFNVQARKGLST